MTDTLNIYGIHFRFFGILSVTDLIQMMSFKVEMLDAGHLRKDNNLSTDH